MTKKSKVQVIGQVPRDYKIVTHSRDVLITVDGDTILSISKAWFVDHKSIQYFAGEIVKVLQSMFVEDDKT